MHLAPTSGIALAEPTLPSWLIQALLVFFFLVLPIVRGIRESLAKKREFERRRDTAPLPSGGEPDVAAQVDEARRRWEALLRGEETKPAPAPPPPPVVAARPTAAEAVPPPLGGALSDFAPAPSEDQVEAANDEETADAEHFIPDEETRAREENDRRLRDEREARAAFLQRERESGAGRRAGVAADPMTSLGAPTAAAVVERARRANPLGIDLATPERRRASLRRAILANEVLGAPIALRDPASGPPGLRRSA